jgi:hypothetical protein
MKCRNSKIKDASGSIMMHNSSIFLNNDECVLTFLTPPGYVRLISVSIVNTNTHHDVVFQPNAEECRLTVVISSRFEDERLCLRHGDNHTFMTTEAESLNVRFIKKATYSFYDGVQLNYSTMMEEFYLNKTTSKDGPNCASQGYGWVPYGRLCVAAFLLTVPWEQANADCAARGGTIVSLSNSQEEQDMDEYLKKWLVCVANYKYWPQSG